jgi:hypothetical protein
MDIILFNMVFFLGGVLAGYVLPHPIKAIYSQRKKHPESDGEH